jgi:glycosyltransferase involved in cell wall biosynthesis
MKVLIISYAFPPIPFGGTYRALRLCRGLTDQSDIDCHVLTLQEYSDFPNDYELLKKVPDSVVVHRVPIFDPWRHYQKIKEKNIGKNWFKVVHKLVSFALRFITFPDHMIFWVPSAVVKASKIIKKEGMDTILVSSPPDSSQLIGWCLKKWLKVRWVADFRDPIYGNVAQVNLIDPTNLMDRVQKKLLLRYEQLIISSADFLVANTETHAEHLRHKGYSDVQAIRNSFDLEEFATIGEEARHPILTIAHVGSIYGNRNPKLLFAAIKQLASEYAPESLKVQIVFLGYGGGSLSDTIEEYGVGEYVKIVAQVPHHEAIEYMCRSHLLLLIKATGKWSKGQIPGKFFEYIGAANPVLCVGPKESEVASLIQEHELGFVVEDDVNELLVILRRIYDEYLRTGKTKSLTKQQTEPFSSATMVSKMSQVLKAGV